MRILAIDPGTTQSAFVLFDSCTAQRPIVDKGILLNCEMEAYILSVKADRCVIEMVASYGMPVGREVFETVYYTGRFAVAWEQGHKTLSERLYRRDVKMQLCQNMRAKDGNIRAVLIDRFGPGKDLAVGKKATPGPLYGVRKDIWAALAVAVTYTEQCAPAL